MLIHTIIYTFAAGDGDKAESILHELRDLSRAEKGVVRFDVARSREKPNVFALWEVYDDQAALDAHLASDHFRRLGLNGVRVLAKERIGETVFPID